MGQKIERHIIFDKPTDIDLFDGKGHHRTARSLAKAIGDFSQDDRSIGLDGPWGSGKSSVVEMASKQLDLSHEDHQPKFHFFTFDIWKSQGSSFRRSFLEHLLEWSQSEFTDKSGKLKDIEKSVRGKTREIETNSQPLLDWFGIALLVALPFSPIFYFWAKGSFDALYDSGDAIKFFSTWPFIIMFGFLVLTIFSADLKVAAKRRSHEDLRISTVLSVFWEDVRGIFNGAWFKKIGFREALSRTLLISSKQHQDQKITQQVREIDPNDYEFHATMRGILAVIQSNGARVVIVLDNIDRLPAKEIKDYWALVRSIFSRGPQASDDGVVDVVTAIVPYDRALIEKGISESGEVELSEPEANDATTSPATALTKLSSREVFAKTFDEILTVAPPVLSNAREFFSDRLREALPAHSSKDQIFRTYRVFCELLRSEGGTTTPRQMVSFINEVSGLFVLHDGQFELSTIAVYLAYQDALFENPSILADENGLDPKIETFAGNPELRRHLAALFFNVETELAFQILLDQKIVEAAIDASSDQLKDLQTSPGFEERIVDVLTDNIEEWRKTGELKKVVQNCSALLAHYIGDAAGHIKTALVDGFESVELFGLSESEFEPYLSLFGMAHDSKIDKLLEQLVAAGVRRVHAVKTPSSITGSGLGQLLLATSSMAKQHDRSPSLKEIISQHEIPRAPDFMFGLAANVYLSKISISDFKDAKVFFADGGVSLSDMAISGDESTVLAFKEFEHSKLLSTNDWIDVANACLDSVSSGDLSEDHARVVWEVAADTWKRLSKSSREEVSFSTAYESVSFFENLEMSDDDTLNIKTVPFALFIGGPERLSTPLAVPTKMNKNNNQRVAVESETFKEYQTIHSGTGTLPDQRVTELAKYVVDDSQASKWVSFSEAHPEHLVAKQVVSAVFGLDSPPAFTMSYLLSKYPFIADTVDADQLNVFLKHRGKSLTETQVEKVKLEDIPIGFLSSCFEADQNGWSPLFAHVEALTRAIPESGWHAHLEAMDHVTKIQAELVATSGSVLDAQNFKDPLVKHVLAILSGERALADGTGSVDLIVGSLDGNYRSEVWKLIREKLSDVSASSLTTSYEAFPILLKDIVCSGRATQSEKNNVVRHILCSALEGELTSVLQFFVEMGHTKVAIFVEKSEESTNNKLDGAWKSFMASQTDKDWLRKVSLCIWGRDRTRGFFETLVSGGS